MGSRPLVVLMFVGACAPSPAPLVEMPAATRPVSTAPVSAAPAEANKADASETAGASTAPATTKDAATTSNATTTNDAVPAAPHVVIESPYSALGHPRLATEMMTLGRDEELFQWALGGSSDPEHPSNRPGYHPATRVVVDVELLSRAPKGSTARLQRIARSTGYWPLRACFETAQRLALKTERSARVRLTVSAIGKVLGARTVGPAPERGYARCVLEQLRALDFMPGFTRKLDVEISLKQWPGHAPVPPRAPDDAPAVHLTTDAIDTLTATTPQLTACYQQGLSSDPKLWGRIALKLSLGNDGTVQQAQPVETHFPNPEVAECVRQVVLGLRVSSPATHDITFAVRFGGAAAPPSPADQGAPPAPAPAAPMAGSPPAPSQ